MAAENAELHYRHGDPCRTLEEAGFGPGQARTLVDLIAARERRLVTSEGMTAYENDVAIVKSGLGELKVRMASVEGRIDGLVMIVEGLRQEVRERSDALRLELTARFEALEARVDRRMSALDSRMDSLDSRMDSLEAKMDGRMGSLEARMDACMGSLEARMNGRMGSLEAKMDACMGSLEAKMNGRMGSLEGKMDGVQGELRTLKWMLGILIGLAAALGAPGAAALVRLAFFA